MITTHINVSNEEPQSTSRQSHMNYIHNQAADGHKTRRGGLGIFTVYADDMYDAHKKDQQRAVANGEPSGTSSVRCPTSEPKQRGRKDNCNLDYRWQSATR